MNYKEFKTFLFYLGFTAIITRNIWVFLTKIRIKSIFTEVGQELHSPALCYIFAVVHHAIQIVEVSLSCMTVPIFLH